ncbi:MAG: hypothetical protein KDK44_05720, partial [Chlamydiia bacterium]|nr:hypothetical protein [Chlamydiia bacterium]
TDIDPKTEEIKEEPKPVEVESAKRPFMNLWLSNEEVSNTNLLIHTLATWSYWELKKRSDEIEVMGYLIHRISLFGFFAYIRTNPEQAKKIQQIKDRHIPFMGPIIYNHVKSGIIQERLMKMEYHQDIEPYLGEFARMTGLDKAKLTSLAKKEHWEDFFELCLFGKA